MSDALIRFGDEELTLPVLEGTEGKSGINIAKLQAQLGLMTFDPGFGNTAEMFSKITYIDGEQAILRYRGYPIEELAENASFLEVAYLLGEGELPNRTELAEFEELIARHMDLDESLGELLSSYPEDSHPIDVLSSVIPILDSFYPEGRIRHTDSDLRRDATILMARLPTLIAWAYRAQQGLPILSPRPELGYVGNFFSMMFATADEDYQPKQLEVAVLNTLLLLHADHTQNCSATAVRLVGSSGASMFASIAAGVGALSGPFHGGANQRVLEMLQTISDDECNVSKYVDMAKGSNGYRLMGFGHRVYKNLDPRASIIKSHTNAVLNSLGVTDPLLDVAKRLEEVALSDDYFLSRRLYPNVDFYSGILYRAMGFPTNMFTVLFALGRLPGWLAQWREMKTSPDTRLSRPRQIYTGVGKRSFLPIDQR